MSDNQYQFDEAVKPYVSGDHASGWDVLDHTGKTVKSFHWKNYADHPIADKKKAAFNDASAYLKKNFNSLSKPVKEDLDEAKGEMSHAQILKKINDGTHEALSDVVPGKHVILRHTATGKRSAVFVKPIREETDLQEAHKVGDKVKVHLGGKWHDAVVTDGPHKLSGHIEAKFKHGTKTFKTRFNPETEVKKIAELAESYVGRETKDGVWRVFKTGNAVAVAGPFKSAAEASAWIKSQSVKEETDLDENYGLHKKYYSMSHDELKDAHSKLVGQQTDLIRKAPNSVERDVIDQKIDTVRGLLKAHQQKARTLKEGADKHRVSVTVSEPDHSAVSMRKVTKEKFIRVTADDKDAAVQKAKAHYKKAGYKVHSAEHVGMIKEEAEQLDELSIDTLKLYTDKAYADRQRKLNVSTISKDTSKKFAKDVNNREKGINSAIGKLRTKVYEEEQIDELSNNLLASYKKKAGEDASKANASMNFKKADKRFSGIVKATNKQFDNDAKARVAKMESVEQIEESDPIPSVYQKHDAAGTYHIQYTGKDKDGNEQSKLYKLKANDNHHAQYKAAKIARGEFPNHDRTRISTVKYFKNESVEEILDDVSELVEKLAFDATPADYIHDFIKSDAPQFAGKSKAKRMKMALAAFYARQRAKNEDINTTEEEILDESSSAALSKKASESGVSLGVLKKVYARGVAAWNSGHRPGTTPQQWGMARVNSYITKGKTYHTADKDLHEDKYCDGLSDKTCKARYAHWDKMSKKDDSDPSAYKEAPGDKTAETKPSKYTMLYKKLYSKKSD